MDRRFLQTFFLAGVLTLGLAVPGPVLGASVAASRPGAPGIGDPYFPTAGNGGYDVRHYGLRLRYVPRTDRLSGSARIEARATQPLSSFHLDLHRLHVRTIRVDGRRASYTRNGDELVVVPARRVRDGERFTTVVRYAGTPSPLPSGPGFLATRDGALVIGQPESATTWFPANDHPSDRASFSFRVRVPRGGEVVANGALVGRRTQGRWTTWHWEARTPMAPYLATLGIGEWEMRRYRRNGIAFHDAVDPALLRHVRPRSGRNMLVSQKATSAYRRLARVIAVPARGGDLSFWLNRDLEPGWDWFFVEARPVGSRRWTTLPDQRGHTRRETAPACPGVLGLHPFLARYQTDRGDGTCTASGSTGEWHAATGRGRGYQKWSIDLDRYAGRRVLVSLSYVTDDVFDFPGAYVDDVTGPRGRGTTSFERDGDRWDGWELRQPPKGSPTTDRSWAIGDRHRQPPTFGEIALGSLRRQPEILRFLSRRFGPYPFGQSGAIVDDARLGFALETQTRPVYASDFFTDRVNGDAVVVHELAHQWYGDSLTVRRWRHIWLNEGFATYAEWLWSAREGRETPRQLFEGYYAGIPADSPFWDVTIGDPGPDALLDVAVYYRGAMTLQVLRNRIGNDDFFRLLRRWARQNRHDVVTTSRFVAMAEQISGRQLDRLFERWLFTPGRPAVPGLPGATVDSEPPPLLGRLLR